MNLQQAFDAGFEAVKAYVDGAIGDFEKRLTVAEKREPLRGETGEPGRDGKDGVDGQAGKDGAPGRDGVDGKDGAAGADGKAGPAGSAGAPGRDGKDFDHTQLIVPEDISEMISKAAMVIAESAPITPRVAAPVVVAQPERKRGPTKKTITTRRDADGNLVADVVEE